MLTYLLIACSIGLTAFTDAHPAKTPCGDTLRPLPPPGYVLLSHNGFRLVLKQREDLKTCTELLANKDSVIQLQALQAGVKDIQINAHRNINKENEAAIKVLKRKVFWKNAEIWGMRAVSVILIYKLIF